MVRTSFRNLISRINQLIRFAKKVECITTEAEKIKMEQKGSFPEVFSADLGKFTKITAKFELKENTRPIFRKKRNVPFAATEEINKEVDRLVNMGVLSKVEFSDKLLPKQNKLRKTTSAPKKGSIRERKNYFKRYQNNTSCWERRIVKEPVTETSFERLQQRPTNRRRANRHYFRHVRFRSSSINTWKTSIRENKKIHRPVDDRPKKKKILTVLLRSKNHGGGVLRESYPSHHNGLFSPLLVRRDFAARRADQYRCYLKSTTLLTFSM